MREGSREEKNGGGLSFGELELLLDEKSNPEFYEQKEINKNY
jgi:hypothetical protein